MRLTDSFTVKLTEGIRNVKCASKYPPLVRKPPTFYCTLHWLMRFTGYTVGWMTKAIQVIGVGSDKRHHEHLTVSLEVRPACILRRCNVRNSREWPPDRDLKRRSVRAASDGNVTRDVTTSELRIWDHYIQSNTTWITHYIERRWKRAV